MESRVSASTAAAVALFVCLGAAVFGSEAVKIGLNYPETGPYSVQGLDQFRAASMAVEEINAAGGILGRPVVLVVADSRSNVDVSRRNVARLIDQDRVKMVFGGSSSAVAVAAGQMCQRKGVPFFATLTYSTATTGSQGRRFTFRECCDARMAANAIGEYLRDNFAGKKYMYITADYTWGWITESCVRSASGTEDGQTHKGVLTPLGATDFGEQLTLAKMIKPDVLVLVLFGKDLSNAIRQATAMGLKSSAQIVVPNLTLGMAEGGGPRAMEGVVGAAPWTWRVPYKYDYPRGKKFVEDFSSKFSRYPSTSGASAYTIVYEYKSAVERAGSLDAAKVVLALEGHSYTFLKDEQTWRDFDHQSVQTVYALKCKPAAAVVADRYQLDYFEIMSSVSGDRACITKSEWQKSRREHNLPAQLEPLDSMAGN